MTTQHTNRCAGMRDWLPQDMARFRRVEDAFRKASAQRGYQEVRTPTLEYLYFFTSAGRLTPEKLRNVYSFLDLDGWSGERVVLRPDGTIPIARLFSEHPDWSGQQRFCYVENTFSFSREGDQPRERWQCGAEFIGVASPQGDVELVQLGLETLSLLGLDAEVRLFHAGLARALSEQKDGVADLFQTGGKAAGFCRNLRPQIQPPLPKAVASLDHLASLAEALDKQAVRYHIDALQTHDFEYYTGAMFSFVVQGKLVGSGGRYDDLVSKMGGAAVPASGFALYVEPLVELLA